LKSKIMVFIVLIFVGFIAYRLFNGINHSNTIYGLVTSKELNPYRITIKVDENINSAGDVEIIIKDENIWNLVEINREYKINYIRRNNETPTLRYIENKDIENIKINEVSR
jgi:hypothetical protein